MTAKDEIVAMMDYLGMDQFPQDGYNNYDKYFNYDGEFIDGYDGYQVSLIYDKNDDTLKACCHNYGSGFTPRPPRLLCILYPPSEQDPDPIDLDPDSPDGSAIMSAMHGCLVVACRDKATKKAVNDELSAASLEWCQC
jgi:hypothetical protein